MVIQTRQPQPHYPKIPPNIDDSRSTTTIGAEAASETTPEDSPPPSPNAIAAATQDINDPSISAGDTGTVTATAKGIEAGGFSYRQTAERDMLDHGSDVLHHAKYVVFRRGGALKAGPSDVGVAPRSWRFNPGSRRILFEVDVPARGITLR